MIKVTRKSNRYPRSKSVVERNRYEIPESVAKRIARAAFRAKAGTLVIPPCICRNTDCGFAGVGTSAGERGTASIKRSGDVQIGCQYIPWDEIERFGKRRKWFVGLLKK